MTKSELIDAVKRWQIAVFVSCVSEGQKRAFSADMWYHDDFFDATKTFLTLLDQLEPDTHKFLLVKRGDLLPIDYSRFPELRITNPNPTDPGVGFCGVNYSKGDPEE